MITDLMVEKPKLLKKESFQMLNLKHHEKNYELLY